MKNGKEKNNGKNNGKNVGKNEQDSEHYFDPAQEKKIDSEQISKMLTQIDVEMSVSELLHAETVVNDFYSRIMPSRELGTWKLENEESFSYSAYNEESKRALVLLLQACGSLREMFSNKEAHDFDSMDSLLGGAETQDELKKFAAVLQELLEQAEHILVFIHRGLVNSFIKTTVGEGENLKGIVDIHDLKQEGYLGILVAVRKFDLEYRTAENEKTKVSTYCVHYIRKYIYRFLKTASRTIRIPEYLYAELYTLKKIEALLTQELLKVPTIEEITNVYFQELIEKLIESPESIAKHYDTEQARIDRVMFLLSLKEDVVSLDMPVSEKNLLEEMVSSEEESIELAMITTQFSQEVLSWIADDFFITPRQRDVLQYIFGLNGFPELSMIDTAKKMGISNERVRQLRNIAVEKLLQRIKLLKKENEDL